MKKTNLSWCASIHEKMHLFFDLIPVVNALVSRLATSYLKKKRKLHFKMHWKTKEENPTENIGECKQKHWSMDEEKKILVLLFLTSVRKKIRKRDNSISSGYLSSYCGY